MFAKMKVVLFSVLILIGSVLLILHFHERQLDGEANQRSEAAPSAQSSHKEKAKLAGRPEKKAAVLKKNPSAPLPEEKKLTAPFVSQKPELPNGCEVTSLTMLLNSANVKVTKLRLAAQLKKVPFQSGEYMGNPHEGFVGNMYHGDRNHPGYAVYHEPVASLARLYLGRRTIDLSGKPWERVEGQIASNHPVWVITSINFQPIPEGNWRPWKTRQGTLRISFMEHSVLVTGYDQKYVYFNDPMASAPGSKADKHSFETAWKQFGNQAISYAKK
ncbi:MAG: C39 family peptidase [Sporolactobacillus sp.]